MSNIQFKEWPKTYRFNRPILVTEKIDGTNAQVTIISTDGWSPEQEIGISMECVITIIYTDIKYILLAGSRSKFLSDKKDNFGFWKWVNNNKEELIKLGEGTHFGEWWGNGIQRGYGMPDGVKNFSLFNVKRWKDNPDLPDCCKTVPLLYEGLMDQVAINNCLRSLKANGSRVAPFMNPEGIVIYHIAANTAFKITLVGDEKHKSDTKKVEATK